MSVRWQRSRFQSLSPDDLYDLLALRCRVFVLEQGPYLDPDGLDRTAWHLLGRDEENAPVAYLRLLDAGARFAEPSIGRVCVAPERRARGVGRELMHEGLALAARMHPGQPNRISAQAHLERFYAGLGYRAIGGIENEDGIPHLPMRREG